MDFLSPFNVISTVVSNHCHLNWFFYCFQMSIIGFPVQFHGGQQFIRKEHLPLLPHVFIKLVGRYNPEETERYRYCQLVLRRKPVLISIALCICRLQSNHTISFSRFARPNLPLNFLHEFTRFTEMAKFDPRLYIIPDIVLFWGGWNYFSKLKSYNSILWVIKHVNNNLLANDQFLI
jgi:hypothetical protein